MEIKSALIGALVTVGIFAAERYATWLISNNDEAICGMTAPMIRMSEMNIWQEIADRGIDSIDDSIVNLLNDLKIEAQLRMKSCDIEEQELYGKSIVKLADGVRAFVDMKYETALKEFDEMRAVQKFSNSLLDYLIAASALRVYVGITRLNDDTPQATITKTRELQLNKYLIDRAVKLVKGADSCIGRDSCTASLNIHCATYGFRGMFVERKAYPGAEFTAQEFYKMELDCYENIPEHYRDRRYNYNVGFSLAGMDRCDEALESLRKGWCSHQSRSSDAENIRESMSDAKSCNKSQRWADFNKNLEELKKNGCHTTSRSTDGRTAVPGKH